MAIAQQVTVTTAGTRVALTAGGARLIYVRALAGNTGVVYVGDVAVSAANGYELSAGEYVLIHAPDYELASIYVDAATNGDKVCAIVAEPADGI